MLIANLLFLFIGVWFAKFFSRVSLVPKTLLWPTVFILSMVGAYGIEQSMVDVWIMLIAGFLGFILKRHGFGPAPIIMGLVLGGLVETSLAQSMILFNQEWGGFLTRPIALLFFVLATASLTITPFRSIIRRWQGTPDI